MVVCVTYPANAGCEFSQEEIPVLEKEQRASDTAALYAMRRDIEYQESTLRFRDCSWVLVERKSQEQLVVVEMPSVLFWLVAFYGGTALPEP